MSVGRTIAAGAIVLAAAVAGALAALWLDDERTWPPPRVIACDLPDLASLDRSWRAKLLAQRATDAAHRARLARALPRESDATSEDRANRR